MIKINPSIALTAAMAATRAARFPKKVADGLSALYRLGTGGRKPDRDNPLNELGQCDCSGYSAWSTGIDRFQGYDKHGNERWVNTDAILYAAVPSAVEEGFESDAATGMYRKVRKDEAVMPGDLLVYGSTRVSGDRVPGHVGVIVEVKDDFVRGGDLWWRHLSVAHCSPSNSKKFGSGHAIAITDAAIWRKRGYIVRPTYYAAG